MNGWNDFQYNMAAGARRCGACYWLLPGYNSGGCARTGSGDVRSRRRSRPRAETPLKSFVGNSCTSAMNSFQTVGDIALCSGVGTPDGRGRSRSPSRTPRAYSPFARGRSRMPRPTYYPHVGRGSRVATRCDVDDCSATRAKVPKCCSSAPAAADDGPAELHGDRARPLHHVVQLGATNFAASGCGSLVVVSNSAITDVQNGGLTFVTGGDYSASVITATGRWRRRAPSWARRRRTNHRSRRPWAVQPVLEL